MKHPFTGQEIIRLPRTCPVPGLDLAFGDGVVWQGKPWVVNSLHRFAADGVTRLADLVRWGHDPDQTATASAPAHELRVFQDAEPYGVEEIVF